MGISLTRFSAAAVVVLQWLAVLVVIRVGSKNERIFADFDVTLPALSAIALQAAQPMVLVPIALASTATTVVAEVLLQSASRRSAVQVPVLFLWLAFTCFCLIALEMPLLTILRNVS